MTALAAGNERAAAMLYDRHAAMLGAVAFRITRSRVAAEEVVLETLEQAWRQAASFDGSRGSLPSWLAVIARSRALDLVRRDQRAARFDTATEHELAAVEDTSEDARLVGDGGESAERRALVASALAALPAAQREAVELAFFDGLSHAEMAERLATPLGTVKTRLRLAMAKLRDSLHLLSEDVS
jgi:RNA polymerase sigma-70 factor (ECF subfamily)